MPCFHPLKAYYRLDEDTGKKRLAFVDSNDLPFYFKDGEVFHNKIEIPCGQCFGCRLDYSRQWAVRCMMEASQWKNNWFLTLTYDNEHLPPPNPSIVSSDTGEVLLFHNRSSLCRDDIVKFIKNLRRQCEYHFNHIGLRVFYCGEYGEENLRPHYHMILFNAPEFKMEFFKENFRGDKMYNCDFLSKVWKKGFVVAAEVNFDTCAYVARYIMKKHKGKDAVFYELNGIDAEFTGCSRNPGIARHFYDDNKNVIYATDEVFVNKGSGNVLTLHPPKYFDRLYDVDHHDELELLKKNRRLSADLSMKSILERTSLSKEEYLSLKEKNKLNSLKRLLRTI